MDTERLSPRYSGIDLWSSPDVLDAMIEGQFAAIAAVRSARAAIDQAAAGMEVRLKDHGRLIYAGAGTSARLAVQDGADAEQQLLGLVHLVEDAPREADAGK